jgi:hypothetical protein
MGKMLLLALLACKWWRLSLLGAITVNSCTMLLIMLEAQAVLLVDRVSFEGMHKPRMIVRNVEIARKHTTSQNAYITHNTIWPEG